MVDLDCVFEGVELCPHCFKETSFSFNPMRDLDIECERCGKRIMPCSLCDCNLVDCSSCDCIGNIKKSLIHYNLQKEV